MAITLGTPVTSQTTTTAITNGSASSTLVVGVACSIASGGAPDISATYNSIAMTKLKQQTDAGHGACALFSMTSPSTGANNVVITPAVSTINTISVFIVELTANTNSGQPGATDGNIPTQVPSTGLVCTAVNGLVFDVRLVANEAGYTVGASQTQLFNNINMGSGANLTALASYEHYTSGTVTMSWSGASATDQYCLVEIKGIVPTAYTLTAGTGSFALTFWDAILRTVGITNVSKPTTSITNTSKPTTTFTNVSKPSTSITNSSKPNL